MNTAALDALLDYARDAGAEPPTWDDRGVQCGEERWIVVYYSSDADLAKSRLVAGYGPTLNDAARDACDQLGVKVGFVVLQA